MATVAQLDERTHAHAQTLAGHGVELDAHDGRLTKLELNWARLTGIVAGAAAAGAFGGGGIVLAVARLVGS